jgi:CheY-like chemotaxis protein
MYLDLRDLNVMVVDDNPNMRTIVGGVLAAAEVGGLYYASNGQEAMRVLSETKIDAAYIDFEMPVMNGLELIREIRRLNGEERFMPIIMLTGYADMQRVNAALNAGMTEFLRKPVTAKDILLRLQAAILNARPFVTAGQYFGPDRRRRRDEPETAPKRRASDRPAIEI